MSAQADLVGLGRTRLQLRVNADATGHVARVEILSSSGSVDVDLATQRAVYEWWFQPPLDAAGHLKADVIVCSIDFL